MRPSWVRTTNTVKKSPVRIISRVITSSVRTISVVKMSPVEINSTVNELSKSYQCSKNADAKEEKVR